MESASMAVQFEIEKLKAKHKLLEAELADATFQPSSSDDEILAIRRLKLTIEDKIRALEVKRRVGELR
jgi:hypothetical protein